MSYRTASLTLLSLATLSLITACGGGGGGGSTGSGGGGAGDGTDPFAPTDLEYELTASAFLVEFPIEPNHATWEGIITEFEVEPELPEGLVLDPVEGTLSGTPLVPTEARTYVVTGRSQHGETSTFLELRVTESPSLLMGGFEDGTLAAFRVDPGSGQLETLGLEYAPAEAGALADVVVHPSGQFAYSANHAAEGSEADLCAFRIDPVTGLPELIGTTAFLDGVHSIALAPAGDLAFVTARANHALQAFTIDPGTGLLAPAGEAVSTGTSPDRVLVDPQGRFVCVQNFHSLEVRVYAIDPVTGALTPSGDAVFTSPARRPTDLALSEDGEHLYVAFDDTSEVQQFRVDWNEQTQQAALTWGTRTPTGALPTSLALGPRGTHLLVACQGSNELRSYRVDATSGELSLAGTLATGNAPRSVQMDASGTWAYVSFEGLHELLTVRIDPRTRSLTATSQVRTRPGLGRMAVLTAVAQRQPIALNAYAVNRSSEGISVFTVDPQTGELDAGSETPVGCRPDHVALDPRGRYAWIVDAEAWTLSTADLDAAGAITGLPEGVVALPGEPQGLATDASGRFLFVTVSDPGRVLCFKVPSEGGTPLLVQEVPVPDGPREIACDPTGRFLHLSAGNTVQTLPFSNGELGWEAHATLLTGDPTAVRFAPDGKTAYVGLEAGRILIPCAVEATSGQLVPLPDAALPTTGLRPVSLLPCLDGQRAVVLLADDAMGTSQVLGLDLGEDGRTLTAGAASPLDHPAGGMALNPRSTRLFTTDPLGDRMDLFALPQDGALGLPLQQVTTGVQPEAVLVRRGLE